MLRPGANVICLYLCGLDGCMWMRTVRCSLDVSRSLRLSKGCLFESEACGFGTVKTHCHTVLAVRTERDTARHIMHN